MSPDTGHIEEPDEGFEQEGGDVPITKEMVEEGLRALHQQYGFIWPDGSINNKARGDVSFAAVNEAVVEDLAERADKAVPLADIVELAFHGAPSPPWGEDPDEFDQRVYARALGRVKSDLRIDKGGYVQQKVGAKNGLPPMVLCRTYLGKSQVEAYYVTRNLRCIVADNSAGMKADIKAKALKHADNLAVWMERVPEHAAALEKDYNKGMSAALKAGRGVLGSAREALELEENEEESGE